MSIKSSKTIKLILSDINGYKCAVCGVSEWQSKAISLELEHIDGNSENNSPNNVCLICPNCHSQTPTYKARNKGNGRHYRRQRYAEGKSY
jgi:heterodisulfide reductase subunit B